MIATWKSTISVLSGIIFTSGWLTWLSAATISVDVNDTDVTPGEEFRYTINLDYDGGNGLLSNVEVNDTISAGVTYVGGTVHPAAANYPTDGSTGETIIWRLGSNAAGVIGRSGGGNIISKDVADNITSQIYTNNDGNTNWNGPWTETNDDGSATTGYIQINDEELDLDASRNINHSIYREVDLSSADSQSAIFSVELYHNYMTDRRDRVYIEASADGVSYTQLEEIDENTAEDQTFTYNLEDELGVLSSQTRVRFRVDTNSRSGNRVEFNDISISWTETETGANTSIDIRSDSLLKSTEGSDQITVTMEVNSSTADTVTPSSLTVIDFDGAGASCSSASPASASISAGGSVQFDYTCTLSVGTGVGNVKFEGSVSGSNNYAVGTSPSVLVTPPLTFVVKADDPQTQSTTSNSAWISSYRPIVTDPDACFAISDVSNEIFKIRLDNATATLLGATGVSNIEALKFTPDFTALYAINDDEFGSIDLTDGSFSLIGSIGTVGGSLGEIAVTDADGMTFDPLNDELYVSVRRGTTGDNDLLIKVDPGTGAHIPDAFGTGIDYIVVDFPDSIDSAIHDIDGMSFYPDGTLYAIQNNGGNDDYLTIIDKQTGATTIIDPYDAATNPDGTNGRVQDEDGTSVNDLESLSYMPDGRLYATNGNNSNGVLYSLDRTNGKMLTQGTISDGGDYEGLSCREASSNFSEEVISEQSNIQDNTLPVTIAYVYPVKNGETIDLQFSTATETSNVGFNFYAFKQGKRIAKLNTALVPGAMDSLRPTEYQVVLPITTEKSFRKIEIAAVDINGFEERHGPYRLNKESGEKVSVTLVDWKPIKENYKAQVNLRKDGAVNLDVDQNGVCRVTHQELKVENVNLKGIRASKIALTLKDEGVARYVGGLDERGKWTTESYLDFRCEAPTGSDALYLDANRYRLALDRKRVIDSGPIEPDSAKMMTFENNSNYAWTIPGDDPFYDTIFYTRGEGKPGSVTRTFEVPELPGASTRLTVSVSAFSNLTHQLEVEVNGVPIASVAEAGYRQLDISADIDSGLLNAGANTLKVTAYGTEDNIDVFYYDKATLAYDDGVANPPVAPTVSVSDKVSVKATRIDKKTDYVIIAHPTFMGDVLDAYVAYRESQGWHIQVFNIYDIYENYGYGMQTPSAIKTFLAEAQQKQVTHVQLVGAASYDYRDLLGVGSISFIPSWYAFTYPINHYSPCDSCLVADANGIPQLAIGRWAIRSVEELEATINKTLEWERSGQGGARNALLISDTSGESNKFAIQMDAVAEKLAGYDLTRVSMDTLLESHEDAVAVDMAREAIKTSLNDGVSLVSYSGHSSPTLWSFDGLLKQSDAASIDNEGHTAIALPLACYTNYADDPSINTMAHQFLAGGENGFVAIYGAATLSRYQQNGAAITKVIDYLKAGETLGDAVRKAKTDLGTAYLDIIRNSNVLGDVTLRFE